MNMSFKLNGFKCTEASQFSVETYIPCCRPAVSVVWHDRDQRAYPMCAMCTDHNVRNRGGRLIATIVTPTEQVK